MRKTDAGAAPAPGRNLKLLARHVVLASAGSRAECRAHVLDFFAKTSLVRYDHIVVDDEAVLAPRDQNFTGTMEKALERNHQILAGLVDELGTAGFATRADLTNLAQGYESKVLHIIAHFLDGFIGIDTAFYNLVDDSHWLPAQTADLLRSEPDRFWLFALDCYSASPRESALLHM